MSRRVFITGVSSGLGLELARLALSSGDEVWGLSRGSAPIEHPNFRWTGCDLSSQADLKRVVAEQAAVGWEPEAVILNAGVYELDPEQFSAESAFRQFEVNALSALRLAEAYLPMMQQRGKGHIVYISSISALHALPYRAGYSASKAYASSALDCLRRQHRGSGVGISIVYMGMLDTGMSAHIDVPWFMKYPAERAALRVLAISRGRGGAYFVPFRERLKLLLYKIMPESILDRAVMKREIKR